MSISVVENSLRRIHMLPDGFVFSRYEWLGFPTRQAMQLDGGVCPLLKNGPRKGKPNWKAMTGKRSFVVTVEEIERFESEYEAETGACCNCNGRGQIGQAFTCRRCSGTGKAVTCETA